MVYIPIPNAIRASLEFDLGGQTVVITLGWLKGSAIEETDLDALNGALDDWANDELLPFLSNDLVLQRITSTDQTSESAMSKDIIPQGPPTGGDSAANQAQNVAAVVTHYTDQRGRSYRGRNYIPGLTVNSMPTPGTLVNTFVAGILAAYAALDDVETATGLTHAVLSRFNGGVARTTGVATPVTAYGVNTASDSQRRRLPGRGV